MGLVEQIVIFFSLFVAIVVLSFLFLAFYVKKHKPDDYKKDKEFSLASSDLLLESGQSLKQLIDSSSGSGSGRCMLENIFIKNFLIFLFSMFSKDL